MIIKDLKLRNFRGIKEAYLKDFTGINIFVGKNSSGKSSILESLYTILTEGKGLEYIIKRRGWFGLASIDSLFYFSSNDIRISVTAFDGREEELSITIIAPLSRDIELIKSRGLDVSNIYALELSSGITLYVDSEGRTLSVSKGVKLGEGICNVHFVDWNQVYEYGTPENIYSDVVSLGGEGVKEFIVKVLRELYSEVRDIEPLKIRDRWILHLVLTDKSIPYYVVGDGIRYVLISLMMLSVPKNSVLLLEEPELHTHPSLLRLTTNAIVRAYKERDNQLFISTHSLEFIDMVIDEAKKAGLRNEDLIIHRTILKNGILSTEKYTLDEAEEALRKLRWDLRG